MNCQIKKIFDSFPKLILVAFFIGIVIPFPAKGQSPTPENMVLVNAGGFIRGVDSDSEKTNSGHTKVLKEKLPVSKNSFEDESPARMIYLSSYFIDKYEVSNAQYKEFMRSTDHAAPAYWDHRHLNIPKNPVTGVNWFDANSYCRWNKKRLPTEAEWEKAARGPAGSIYPWGNEWSLDKSNNPYKNSIGTEPVGSYPKGRSPYGLYDISGNVWEWVDSYYLPHPGNPVTRAEYGVDKRVLKGGSWFDCLSYGCGLSAPTFNRSFFTPEVKNNSFGFRCAKTKSP